MNKRYIIGVDAGGTKTIATAYSEEGVMLDSASGGYGNLAVSFEIGMEHIVETIDALIRKMDGECICLVLGCAGIEAGDRKQRAHDILVEKFGGDVVATNDAMIGQYAAFEGKDGILVIAGTGSIAYIKVDGRLERFGGWGHFINDDGSSYSIVIRAIRAITDSYDNGCPGSALESAIFAHLGISALRGLIDFVYSSDKGQIAALLPVVLQVAEAGDPTAKAIFDWAGECLANAVLTLLKRYPLPEIRIAVSGKLLLKCELVSRRFVEVLDANLGEYFLREEPFDPTAGGYYIWKERCSK